MQFIFVSANIDAVRTGTSIGIREDLCKQYNVGDERAMYCCMSMMVSDYRSADSAKNGRRHGANSPNGGVENRAFGTPQFSLDIRILQQIVQYVKREAIRTNAFRLFVIRQKLCRVVYCCVCLYYYVAHCH